MPRARDAATLSRMRSPMTSRSKDVPSLEPHDGSEPSEEARRETDDDDGQGRQLLGRLLTALGRPLTHTTQRPVRGLRTVLFQAGGHLDRRGCGVKAG